MPAVARYDLATLRLPERTSQGFLRADAALTRSGVFLYRNPDGSTRREYRPPEEVFHADSLASFEDAPLTRLHPGRLVDSANVRQVSVGTVKEAPRRDGDLAVARVVVMDADAIAEVESGRLAAVSCGYTCDYDDTPGVSPSGERYDGVQRNIRGNHLALVPAGRAGPEARIRLDAADAVMVHDAAVEPHKESRDMIKIRLDGVDYDASEQLAQALGASQAKLKQRLDSLEGKLAKADEDLQKEKARADAAEEGAQKARADLAAATSPDAVRERVAARLDLERQASKALGDEAKLDSMSDDEIKRAVVIKTYPAAKAKLDGASDAYLQARYDAAVESMEDGAKPVDAVRRAAASGAKGRREDFDEWNARIIEEQKQYYASLNERRS